MIQRDANIHQAIGYLHLVLATERFYPEDRATLTKAVEILKKEMRGQGYEV